MKKILSLILACLMLIVALTGCGNAKPAVTDVSSVKTIGDALKLANAENVERSLYSHYYIYAVTIGGTTYRFVADMDEKTSDALFNLDWEDPDHDAKEEELASPLKIIRIDNVTEGIPSQAELDQMAGKTIEALIGDDWSYNGYDLNEKEIYMAKGGYNCAFTFEGEVESEEPEAEELFTLTVKSVKFLNVSDATYLELDENGDLVK